MLAAVKMGKGMGSAREGGIFLDKRIPGKILRGKCHEAGRESIRNKYLDQVRPRSLGSTVSRR